MTRIAIICGGPSDERGISLNSARSVRDHLGDDEFVQIRPIYVDRLQRFHMLMESQLYSNTPSDFDFILSDGRSVLNHEELIAELNSCDLVFPCIHGAFGEDGQLQTLLEGNSIPFVGSTSAVCAVVHDKAKLNDALRANGLLALPQLSIDLCDSTLR